MALLRRGDLSVTEVCFAVGCSSLGTFSTRFTELVGVPDLEAKLAEVTAAGATVKEPAHDVGGGRLVATVTDPDGNVLGLLQDR